MENSSFKQAVLSNRIQLILQWLIEHESLLQYSDTVKIKLDVKGVSVRGEVTVLPDTKK